MGYVIFSQKVPPENYRDEVGVAYNYPRRYWHRVHEGDRFIYHQPRTRGSGKVYFGCGVIGTISPDPEDKKLRNAELLDYTTFGTTVPVADANGFVEPDIARPADLRGNAVRRISDETAHLILLRAQTETPSYWDDTAPLVQDANDLAARKHLLQERLARLDRRYSNMEPQSRRNFLRQLHRPSSVSQLVKALRGTTCVLCGTPGFPKRDGSRYAEVHHVEELSSGIPGVLGSDNMVVVCATCHRKLHYADVDVSQSEGGWTIVINGETHHVGQVLSPA